MKQRKQLYDKYFIFNKMTHVQQLNDLVSKTLKGIKSRLENGEVYDYTSYVVTGIEKIQSLPRLGDIEHGYYYLIQADKKKMTFYDEESLNTEIFPMNSLNETFFEPKDLCLFYDLITAF